MPQYDDRYDMRAPRPQNAIELFDGQWAGCLPGYDNPALTRFYNDPRLIYFDERIGFCGKRVLELGPLEAFHTYGMLLRGAESITSIEANKSSFLKCLIVKELLGLTRAKFILGDFCQYLTARPPRVDIIFASGVLYHMSDPLSLIESMTRTSDAICVWTHYFDEAKIKARGFANRFSPQRAIRFRSTNITAAEQTYPDDAVTKGGFCGGAERKTLWLTLSSLQAAFAQCGFETHIGKDETDHPHGPAVWMTATRVH